jgi:hypothetical protein
MRLNDAVRRPVVHLARKKKRRGHAKGRGLCGEPGALRMLAMLASTRGKSAPSQCQHVAAALARTARARHMGVDPARWFEMVPVKSARVVAVFAIARNAKDKVGHAVMKVRFATEIDRCSHPVYGILQANVYHDL